MEDERKGFIQGLTLTVILGFFFTLLQAYEYHHACLLYTSDAADDLTRVDLGGRRIIK